VLLARGEEELELFEREDRRLQVGRKGWVPGADVMWLLPQIMCWRQPAGSGQWGSGEAAGSRKRAATRRDLLPANTAACLQEAEVASWQAACTAGAAGAAGAAALAPTSYRRLASEEEVAPLVQRARELLQPKVDPFAGASGLK
jgi:hypothetical protein